MVPLRDPTFEQRCAAQLDKLRSALIPRGPKAAGSPADVVVSQHMLYIFKEATTAINTECQHFLKPVHMNKDRIFPSKHIVIEIEKYLKKQMEVYEKLKGIARAGGDTAGVTMAKVFEPRAAKQRDEFYSKIQGAWDPADGKDGYGHERYYTCV